MKSYTSAVENCLSDSNTHQFNCNVCKEKETAAVCFCVNSEKKLCEEHNKVCQLNFRDKTRHFLNYAYTDVLQKYWFILKPHIYWNVEM